MKKLILFALLFVCFIFTGCSYGGVGLVQNSDGTIVEYYYIPFPEEELLARYVSKQKINTILLDIKIDLDTNLFSSLIDDYQKRIDEKEDYTLEEKRALVEGVAYASNLPSDGDLVVGFFQLIQYEVTFANATCYKEFKNANEEIKEEREIITKKNLFTTTQIVKKDPIFECAFDGTVKVGEYFINLVNQKMNEHLGENQWNAIKQELNYNEYASKFNYSYVVPTARIHSNATSVERDTNGYYYHTWEINLNNIDENGTPITEIEYWTTTANKEVWYILALIVSGIVALSVYLIARNKEKKEINKFIIKDED